MKDVFINKEPVELFKILKFEGIASSGAEAKDMIAAGTVLVIRYNRKAEKKKDGCRRYDWIKRWDLSAKVGCQLTFLYTQTLVIKGENQKGLQCSNDIFILYE